MHVDVWMDVRMYICNYIPCIVLYRVVFKMDRKHCDCTYHRFCESTFATKSDRQCHSSISANQRRRSSKRYYIFDVAPTVWNIGIYNRRRINSHPQFKCNKTRRETWTQCGTWTRPKMAKSTDRRVFEISEMQRMSNNCSGILTARRSSFQVQSKRLCCVRRMQRFILSAMSVLWICEPRHIYKIVGQY